MNNILISYSTGGEKLAKIVKKQLKGRPNLSEVSVINIDELSTKLKNYKKLLKRYDYIIPISSDCDEDNIIFISEKHWNFINFCIDEIQSPIYYGHIITDDEFYVGEYDCHIINDDHIMIDLWNIYEISELNYFNKADEISTEIIIKTSESVVPLLACYNKLKK